MNELFENNEFYRQLPDEVKEKIKGCKTEEEAMDILKQDMIPIPDETMEAMAGGICWDNCDGFAVKPQSEPKLFH